MKPGKYDRKHRFQITGADLRERKRHTEDLPQSFGLDNRLRRVPGHASDRVVPLGSGIPSIDVLSIALENTDLYLSQQGKGYLALKVVPDRFKMEYDSAYRKTL